MIIKKSSYIFALLAMMVSSISAAPGVQAGAAKIEDDASSAFIDGNSLLRGRGCIDEDEDCLSITNTHSTCKQTDSDMSIEYHQCSYFIDSSSDGSDSSLSADIRRSFSGSFDIIYLPSGSVELPPAPVGDSLHKVQDELKKLNDKGKYSKYMVGITGTLNGLNSIIAEAKDGNPDPAKIASTIGNSIVGIGTFLTAFGGPAAPVGIVVAVIGALISFISGFFSRSPGPMAQVLSFEQIQNAMREVIADDKFQGSTDTFYTMNEVLHEQHVAASTNHKRINDIYYRNCEGPKCEAEDVLTYAKEYYDFWNYNELEEKIRDFVYKALDVMTLHFKDNPEGARGQFRNDFNKICTKIAYGTNDNCRVSFYDFDGQKGVRQNMYENKDDPTKLNNCKNNGPKWDQHALRLQTIAFDLNMLMNNIFVLLITVQSVVCHLEGCTCTDDNNFYSEEQTDCPEINKLSDLFRFVQLTLGPGVKVLMDSFQLSKSKTKDTTGKMVQMSKFQEHCSPKMDRYWPSNQYCASEKECNYKYLVMTTSKLWQHNFGFCHVANNCEGTYGWGGSFQIVNFYKAPLISRACKNVFESRFNLRDDGATELYSFGPPLERAPYGWTYNDACDWAQKQNQGNVYDYILGAIPNYCPNDVCNEFMEDDKNFLAY